MKSLRRIGRSASGASRAQVLERAVEVRPLGQHRHGDRAAALVGAHDLRELGPRTQLARRRRAALELRDHADPGSHQRLAEAPLAGGCSRAGPRAGGHELGKRQRPLAPLELLARFGEDAIENRGALSAHETAFAAGA